jgi:uncharacterized protein
MQKKELFFWGAALVVLVALLWAAGGLESELSRPSFERSTFTIVRADGSRFSYKAEVATSDREQAYGLMFVRKMRADEGMIFLYASPREAIFWMKDTLIPLDMLFIRPDGRLGRIAAEQQPHDLTPVYSGEPISAVIEIKGGLARKNGFKEGDKVESPVLQKHDPTQ